MTLIELYKHINEYKKVDKSKMTDLNIDTFKQKFKSKYIGQSITICGILSNVKMDNRKGETWLHLEKIKLRYYDSKRNSNSFLDISFRCYILNKELNLSLKEKILSLKRGDKIDVEGSIRDFNDGVFFNISIKPNSVNIIDSLWLTNEYLGLLPEKEIQKEDEQKDITTKFWMTYNKEDEQVDYSGCIIYFLLLFLIGFFAMIGILVF